MADIICIINTLKSKLQYFRHLEDIDIDPQSITVGNNAVVVRCFTKGSDRPLLLKCYPHHRNNCRAIYGGEFMAEEMAIFSLSGNMRYIDVLLRPWVEGLTLDCIMASKEANYRELSHNFDAMALNLLSQEVAHGDIKPDNIVVADSGKMTPIDWDTAWIPGFTDEDIEECGSLSFSHPQRKNHPFNKDIDDFNIAILSVTLATLALDRENYAPKLNNDCMLFNPEAVIEGVDPIFNQATELLSRCGDAKHYRLAKMLKGCGNHIEGLSSILRTENFTAKSINEGTISRQGLYWGIKDDNHWIVPPLYDNIEKSGDRMITLHLGDHHQQVEARNINYWYNNFISNRTSQINGRRWCNEEIDRLAMWLLEDISIETIAKSLSRTPQSVRTQIRKTFPKNSGVTYKKSR